MTRRLKALSLRGKLTLVFAAVMALVLALIGSFLFYRTKANLDDAIAQSLRSRAGNLAQSIRAQPAGAEAAGNFIEPGERFAQVVSPNGRVLDSRPQIAPPLLSLTELEPRSRFIERGESDRLLVIPVRAHIRPFLAVVGASLADREQVLEGLVRAMFIGGPLALLLACALAYWIATATLRPVELMRRRAAEITAADQDARLPVPASQDEIHGLAVTLNDMLARLTEVADRQRSFVANASHEIRTPLAMFRAELELALRHSRTIEEFRAAARNAIGDADDLARLASDLLVLAQLDRDGVPVRRQNTALDALLVSVACEVRKDPLAGERLVQCRSSGLTAEVDPDRLTQALRNMGRNALLHGAGNIVFGADRSEHALRVWVDDGGEPLARELSETAFDRFVRGRGARDRPGAGLGLAIVQEVARAHGGSAGLFSADGHVRCEISMPLPGNVRA